MPRKGRNWKENISQFQTSSWKTEFQNFIKMLMLNVSKYNSVIPKKICSLFVEKDWEHPRWMQRWPNIGARNVMKKAIIPQCLLKNASKIRGHLCYASSWTKSSLCLYIHSSCLHRTHLHGSSPSEILMSVHSCGPLQPAHIPHPLTASVLQLSDWHALLGSA